MNGLFSIIHFLFWDIIPILILKHSISNFSLIFIHYYTIVYTVQNETAVSYIKMCVENIHYPIVARRNKMYRKLYS